MKKTPIQLMICIRTNKNVAVWFQVDCEKKKIELTVKKVLFINTFAMICVACFQELIS